MNIKLPCIRKFGEGAYFIGIILLALGTALMAKADFGVSVIVAPAYIISMRVQAFTFGMAEYTLQACLLVIMCIVIRRFRLSYLFSFVTAVLYGIVLDIWMAVVADIAVDTMIMRAVLYVLGFALSTLGVAFLIQTYLAPEVYELFVKEVSARYKLNFGKTKIVYDCTSCVISFVMSYMLFGGIRGIGTGSVLCAFINGPAITFWCRILIKIFRFEPFMGRRFVDAMKVSEYDAAQDGTLTF